MTCEPFECNPSLSFPRELAPDGKGQHVVFGSIAKKLVKLTQCPILLFRSTALRAEVSSAMVRTIVDVNYTNLKHEVVRKRGQKRSLLYREVWDVLYRLKADRAFTHNWPAAPAGAPVWPS